MAYADWRDAHGSDCEKLSSTDEDVCSQLYSSGTTGHPKGVQSTNANFKALFATVDWNMDDDSRNLAVLPFFHIGGGGWALFGMVNGATTFTTREFDPAALEPVQERFTAALRRAIGVSVAVELRPAGEFERTQFKARRIIDLRTP